MIKKQINGRNKGNAFERQVAKALATATRTEFRRTPLSGGWAAKGNATAAGDIVCMDATDFPFCIECKCEEGWHFESLFTDKHAWFDNWWEQAVAETPAGKVTVLVFSRARLQTFVAMGSLDAQDISFCASLQFIYNESYKISIFLFSDFLAALVKD